MKTTFEIDIDHRDDASPEQIGAEVEHALREAGIHNKITAVIVDGKAPDRRSRQRRKVR